MPCVEILFQWITRTPLVVMLESPLEKAQDSLKFVFDEL